MGVVVGSKACIAGYSAAAWAYYRHYIGGVGREGRKVRAGKEGKGTGRKKGEEKSVWKPR